MHVAAAIVGVKDCLNVLEAVARDGAICGNRRLGNRQKYPQPTLSDRET